MIELRDVCKSYRSGRGRVDALAGVSLSVARGAMAVLAGRSGSGKTTLLHCIGGLERPDRGRVACDGVYIGSLSARSAARFQRRRIGFVFQRGNLISYLTVAENLAFPLELNGTTGRPRERRIEELLDGIGLKGAGDAMPHELSGGETQRVAFARAIAHAPAILLVDEPTANLDSATGRQLTAMMGQLSRERGCTLVAASHDPEVIAMGAEVFYLTDGRLEGSR